MPQFAGKDALATGERPIGGGWWSRRDGEQASGIQRPRRR